MLERPYQLPLLHRWLGRSSSGDRWDRCLGGGPCHTCTDCEEALPPGGVTQEGAGRSHTKAVSLTGSLSGSVSELILNAKKGNGGARGASRPVGRRPGSDLIWTLGCHPSRSEQVLQSLRCYPARGPRLCTHKVRMHYSGDSVAPRRFQGLGNMRPSFPKSPLCRSINKQDGSLYSHFAAGKIHSHNRKPCTRRRRALRDSAGVPDLYSRARPRPAELLSKEMLMRGRFRGPATLSSSPFYENSLT